MTSESSDDARPFHVLFVCTGNTCRSPMAEAIARRELRARGLAGVRVSSAGAAAGPGTPASGGARRVASRHGLDLDDHESTPLTRELLEGADLVLVMSPSHLARVASLDGRARTALIGAFAAGRDGLDGPPVPDPFGGDDALYEETYRSLEDMVSRSLARLETLLAT